uniref:C2H2-type domain-containing protein n=1 Tax=Leptobrachium leishanense TaxID=445787 RepID=A0A8C5PC48_9ANUR
MTMDKEKNPLSQRILDLTLEIIYLLTGEDHEVVKKPGGSLNQSNIHHAYEKDYRTQSPSALPTSPSPIHERHNEQKILELSNQIIRLLTGEVPIRCEDVTVYLSMEEWEYVERHKELYEDVMMETAVSGHSPVSRPDLETKNETENKTYRKYLRNNHSEQDEAVTIPSCTFLSCGKGNLVDTNIYQTADPQTEYPSADIKQEPASCEEENLTDSVLYKPTEHPQTQYPPTDIKEEPGSWEEGNLTDTDIYRPINHSQAEYLYTVIKEEPACEEGNVIGQGDGTFTCIECGKCLPTKYELIQHYMVHTGEHPFKCSDCGKGFYYKNDMVKHQRIHTGEKPFKCNECGRCFTHSSSLACHKVLHTGEKPFKCDDCGKYFSLKKRLNEHQKTHTGQKPFICSDCGNRFTRASTLAAHKMIHTGEKRFICNECGKGFNRRYTFMQHQKIHRR